MQTRRIYLTSNACRIRIAKLLSGFRNCCPDSIVFCFRSRGSRRRILVGFRNKIRLRSIFRIGSLFFPFRRRRKAKWRAQYDFSIKNRAVSYKIPLNALTALLVILSMSVRDFRKMIDLRHLCPDKILNLILNIDGFLLFKTSLCRSDFVVELSSLITNGLHTKQGDIFCSLDPTAVNVVFKRGHILEKLFCHKEMQKSGLNIICYKNISIISISHHY